MAPVGANNGGNVTLTFTGASGLLNAAGAQATLAQGDVVVCAYASSGTADAAMSTSSSGWTEIHEGYANGTSNDTNLALYYKVMGATPDTSFVAVGPTGNSNATIATAFAFRGVDAAVLDIAFVAGSHFATGTASTRPNAPAITPVTAGAWIVVAGAGSAVAGGTYASSDLSSTTNHFRTGNHAESIDCAIGMGIKTDWASGAFDAAAWTGGAANAGDSWAAIVIALKPQGAVETPKTLDRTVTPTRSLVRQTGQIKTRTTANTASIVKGWIANRTFSRTTTPTHSLVRQAGKLINRTINPLRSLLKPLSKQINRTVAAGLTRRSVIAKRIRAKAGPKGLHFVGGKTVGLPASASPPAAISLTDLTGGIASAPAADDLVVVVYNIGCGVPRSPSVTTVGYTADVAEYMGSPGADTDLYVGHKIMGTSPDTSVQLSEVGSGSPAGVAIVHVWRGVNPTTPIDVAVPAAVKDDEFSIIDPPAITPATDGAVVLCVGGIGVIGNLTAPTQSGTQLANFLTIVEDGGFDAHAGIGSFVWTSGTGAFDPVAWGGPGGTFYATVAASIALRPWVPGQGGGGSSGTSAATDSMASTVKSIGKPVSRTATATATLVRRAGKLISHAASGVASIVADFIAGGGTTFNKTLDRTIAASGIVVRQTAKIVTRTTAVAAAVQRSLVRQFNRTATGSSTIVKRAGKSLSQISANTAALRRAAGHYVQRTVTPTYMVVKGTAKSFARAAAISATTTQIKVLLTTIQRSASGIATLRRSTLKLIPRTIASVASAQRAVASRVQHAITPTAIVLKRTFKAFAQTVTTSQTAAGIKVVLRNFSRLVSNVASVTATQGKAFSAVTTPARSLVRVVGKILTWTVQVTRSVVRTSSSHPTVPPDRVATIYPLIRRLGVPSMNRRFPVGSPSRRASISPGTNRRAAIEPIDEE
jgi:hypothetical protein